MRAGRTSLGALALATAGIVLSACSSPSHPSSSGSGTIAPGSGHSSGSTSSSTTPASATTLPVAPASGPLHIYDRVALPITEGQVTAAEAPDGTVFVAPVTFGSGGAPASTVVWVIDGYGPAAVAEHFAGPVTSLAADGTTLYVANDAGVTAYARSTGTQSAQWALPPVSTANTSDNPLTELSASNGVVLVSVAQGNGVNVYRITAGSSAPPQLVVQALSAAFGSDGSMVYERSDHHLVELSATGSSTVGPALADAPNGLGGGVQYVGAVAGGYVWVSEPAGQGLDAGLTTFDLRTLHQLASFAGTANEQIVGTSGGVLALNSPYNSSVCPNPTPTSECVMRLSPTGQLTDGTSAGATLVLVGPYPAVISPDASDTALQLQRLS